MRISCASSNSSATSSFRGRACGSSARPRRSRAPILPACSASTAGCSTRSAPATGWKRAARCAIICSGASSATARSPSVAPARRRPQRDRISGGGKAMVQRVLMTGAAGGIGTRLRGLLKGTYAELRLSDVKRPPDLGPDEPFVAADLARIEEVEAAVDGVDGIIHLGGHSVEGSWETILQANIIGCYNLFEAVRRKGVERVVFASSNHAIGFYRRYRRIDSDNKVRPDSRYGVSKVFGEAIGSLYADKHGMRVT